MTTKRLIPVAAVLLITSGTLADPPDAEKWWPQWRGPMGNGVSPAGDPPTEWSETKNIRWKVAIPGAGNATPIVWGDRIFVLTAIKTERSASAVTPDAPEAPAAAKPSGPGPAAVQDSQPAEGRRPRGGREGEQRPRSEGQDGGRRPPGRGGMPGTEKPKNVYEYCVLALDRKTGETLWQTKVNDRVPHAGTHQDGSFASASPLTDGERIYAFFGSGGLYCLDMAGKVKWQANFGDMQVRMNFGEGASPALSGDTLIVNWDHEGDDFIAAFDRHTGKERWRKTRDEPTTWATPLIVENAGRKQVVTSGKNRIRSYDLETGEIVWECSGLTENVIPSPTYADGVVYLTSGYRGAALKAIRLADAKGKLEDDSPAIIWTYARETPYVPSPLAYMGGVYFLDNTRAILTCLNAKTGEKFYGPQRMENIRGVYSSPVGAAGRVYIATRDGKTVVLKAGEKYEVLATNELDDDFEASPVVVGNELYLRGHKSLYCVATK